MTTELTSGAGLRLADILVRLAHLVDHVFADVSRAHALTPQQAHLLCMLVDGPVGMTELSQLLHLEKSSLTGLVDRVERRELVTRVRDSRDRRACRIALTDAGRRLAEDCHRGVVEQLDAQATEVGDADRKRVTRVVTQLLSTQDGAGAPPR